MLDVVDDYDQKLTLDHGEETFDSRDDGEIPGFGDVSDADSPIEVSRSNLTGR
jgi:hypothetical protein